MNIYSCILCVLVFVFRTNCFKVQWNPDLHGYHYQQAIPQDVMVDIINYLGLSLLEIHNEDNNNNIAISPYGAASVLVAIGEGLKGSAGYEIQRVMHLPDDISIIRVGLRDIHRHLKSYFIPKEGFLSGLTLNKENVTLNSKYEDILRFYGYDIESFNNALVLEPFTTTLISITRTTDIDVIRTTDVPEKRVNDETTVKMTTQKATTIDESTTEFPVETSTDADRSTRSTAIVPTESIEITTTSTTRRTTTRRKSTPKRTQTTTPRIETTTSEMTTTQKVMSTTEVEETTSTTTEAPTRRTTSPTTTVPITTIIENEEPPTTNTPSTAVTPTTSITSTEKEEFSTKTSMGDTITSTVLETTSSEGISEESVDDSGTTTSSEVEPIETTTTSQISIPTKKSKLTKRTTKLADEIYMASTEPMTYGTQGYTTPSPRITTRRGSKPTPKMTTKIPELMQTTTSSTTNRNSEETQQEPEHEKSAEYMIEESEGTNIVTTIRPSTVGTDVGVSPQNRAETSTESLDKDVEAISDGTISKEQRTPEDVEEFSRETSLESYESYQEFSEEDIDEISGNQESTNGTTAADQGIIIKSPSTTMSTSPIEITTISSKSDLIPTSFYVYSPTVPPVTKKYYTTPRPPTRRTTVRSTTAINTSPSTVGDDSLKLRHDNTMIIKDMNEYEYLPTAVPPKGLLNQVDLITNIYNTPSTDSYSPVSTASTKNLILTKAPITISTTTEKLGDQTEISKFSERFPYKKYGSPIENSTNSSEVMFVIMDKFETTTRFSEIEKNDFSPNRIPEYKEEISTENSTNDSLQILSTLSTPHRFPEFKEDNSTENSTFIDDSKMSFGSTSGYEATSSKLFMTTYKTFEDDLSTTQSKDENNHNNNNDSDSSYTSTKSTNLPTTFIPSTNAIESSTKKFVEISTTYLPTIGSTTTMESSTTKIPEKTLVQLENIEIIPIKNSNKLDLVLPTNHAFENTISSQEETSVFEQGKIENPVIYATDSPRGFSATKSGTEIDEKRLGKRLNYEATTVPIPSTKSAVLPDYKNDYLNVFSGSSSYLDLELTPPVSTTKSDENYGNEGSTTPGLNLELTPPETTVESFRRKGINVNNWSNKTSEQSEEFYGTTLKGELTPPETTVRINSRLSEPETFQPPRGEELIGTTFNVELSNSSSTSTLRYRDFNIGESTNENSSNATQKQLINNINNLNVVPEANVRLSESDASLGVVPLISTSIITEKDKVNAYIETKGASQISIKIENQFDGTPNIKVHNLQSKNGTFEENREYGDEPKVIINGVPKSEGPYSGTTLRSTDGSSYEITGIPEFFLSDDVTETAKKLNSTFGYSIGSGNGTENEPSRLSLKAFESTKRKTRSIVDYIIARYYDNHYVTNENGYHHHGPYEPDKSFTFLVNGKHREGNINFMTYDAVLPFYFAPNLNAMALSFPLDSPRYYLLLLLPADDDGIDRLIRDVRKMGSLRRIIKNLKHTHVKAQIPSFMLKGYVVLTPTLQKLGIRKIFEPRQADFTPMTKDSDTYVTNIEQAVTVTIRNYVDPESLRNFRNLHQYGTVEFKADHPFLYFVMDSDINVTLMTGKIVNPLNSRIR